MKKVSGENYEIIYSEGTSTITFQGSLRLLGTSSYAPIIELLDELIAAAPKKIIIQLHELKFLNSSGINTLSKFVIKVRNLKTTAIVVQGTEKFPWQNKSLQNLKRLMPDLQLEIQKA
jgi:hypothetical protein